MLMQNKTKLVNFNVNLTVNDIPGKPIWQVLFKNSNIQKVTSLLVPRFVKAHVMCSGAYI
jgi:hypothetical protein